LHMMQDDEDCRALITYEQLVEMLVEGAVIPSELLSIIQKSGQNQSSSCGGFELHTSQRRRRLAGVDEIMSPTSASICLDHILQGMDPEGRELFKYPEVRIILQRMREATRQKAHQKEAAQIEKLGFSAAELEDMQALFDTLDTRQHGFLTEADIDLALRLLDIPVQREILGRIAFRTFDWDGSGGLDFVEFLRMLKMVQTQDGPFKKTELTSVNTLSDMERCDLLLVIDSFKVPISRFDGMPDENIANDLAEMLGISKSSDLPRLIGGGTLKTLLKYAEGVGKLKGVDEKKGQRKTLDSDRCQSGMSRRVSVA
ncbi:unnamed protein product, partial [Polarella glacialis]